MADEDLSFDLDAAGLRVDGADISAYVEALAHKLELALPAQTDVQRRSKRLLSRDKVVESITVQLGEMTYQLRAHGHRVETSRGKAVRNVTIRNEPLDLDSWVRALAGDLSARASESAEARAALERLVG
jgi:hypothetical protein